MNLIHRPTNRQRFVRPFTTLEATAQDYGSSLTVRFAVLLLAVGILYLRMPESFIHPQLYAEDNDFLYKSQAYGWLSLSSVIAGWLAVVQFLVAILASYSSTAFAPAIYNYGAFVLTLLVVWLVTSPRFDMPYKPLLGIAVVIVPMGYEELGTLTNIQWVLPIGAFAFLFMRAPESLIVLAGEALLVALVTFSGAFCIFLSPLFLWKLFKEREEIERRRFALLTIIMYVGAVTQVAVLALHPSVLNLVASTPYSWTVWVNLPFTQFMTTFGPEISELFHGVFGAILGLIVFALAVLASCRQPYRLQKLFMMYFALAIALSGMFKFRAALETQFSTQRYFYVGGVFVLWFICCLTAKRYIRTALAAIVVLAELRLLPLVANTPRYAQDLEWPVWARYLPSGLPVIIPTTPAGFYLSLPATVDGPLAQFAPWLGRNIFEHAGPVDPAACAGAMNLVEPAGMIYLQPVRGNKEMWIARGTAWSIGQSAPVKLVALVDRFDRVVGFGFPGFATQTGAANAPARSHWISIFYSDPGTTIRAYGIVDDAERLCPFANHRSFPLDVRPLASDKFLGAVKLVPGQAIVQRFKPTERLEEISVPLVTWGQTPSIYTVDWKIIAYSKGQALDLGSGTINTHTITDWQKVKLPLTSILDDVADQIEVRFSSSALGIPAAPVGLPLYQPSGNSTVPNVEVNGTPLGSDGQLGLSVAYAR